VIEKNDVTNVSERTRCQWKCYVDTMWTGMQMTVDIQWTTEELSIVKAAY